MTPKIWWNQVMCDSDIVTGAMSGLAWDELWPEAKEAVRVAFYTARSGQT